MLPNNNNIILRWRYTVTRLMIFIAVANVLAITRNYSPKIALRVHLLDAMKTGASSTVANGGPHEEILCISTRIAVLCSRTRNCWCSSGACFAVFCVLKKNQRIYQEKLFVWPSGKLFKAS